jgi:S-adenosylmethionine:tRNA ribosyltransferase-isomerase
MLNPMLTSSYDYFLPTELIAQKPIYPKENAKLLIYNRKNKTIEHTTFKDFKNFIPNNSAIIFNDTKVIKARIFGKKESGGTVEVLINRPLQNNNFSFFVRGRIREKTKILFNNNLILIIEKLLADGSREGKFFKNGEILNFSQLIEIIEEIGEMPIPPYIENISKIDMEKDYQPVFAREFGAVASPTASLHFSENMLEEIKQNFQTAYLTLHVGAGTFKPVDVEKISDHKLHSEIFMISENAKKIIDSDINILAIGTTVTRTIEYYYKTQENFGETNIFLHEENRPKRVTSLLTNFHLPKSSLLMLVSSFIGIDEVHRIYREAIENRYRFYSYGDAMLII